MLIDEKAPDFSLFDQRDQLITLKHLEGRPIVFIASDKEGRKQNDQWRKIIVEKYGGKIHILGVADVRMVPFFLKSTVKKDFQNDPARIILDWDGVFFVSYGLAKNVSNIVLIDKKGFVRFLYSGSAEPEAVGRLFQEIEKSLE